MKRVVAIALALAVSTVPAADARRPQPGKCLSVWAVAAKGKPSAGCHRFGGRAAPPSGPRVAMTALATPPLPPLPPPPPPPATVARLGVTAREWSLVLSRSTLPAGRALVELQNFGEDAHNLRLERVDGSGAPLNIPLAESGERQKADGVLAAGEYKVYCALPGHDAQGMHARLLVN
jgi:hypothetical protein